MVVMLLIGLMTLRSVGEFVGRAVAAQPRVVQSSGSEMSWVPVEAINRTFLYKGNFNVVDTWPIAEAYVLQNGYLHGKTILLMPASLLPAWFRWQNDLGTSVDTLNYFCYGQTVIDTQWGFNVNLAQGLYINWGGGWEILAIIPGVLTWLLDRWLWQVPVISVFSVFGAGAAWISGGFTRDPGSVLSYIVAYLLVGKTIAYFAKHPRTQRRRPIVRSVACMPEGLLRGHPE
ncbi:MAG: hypothetical protein ABFD89_19945 [Bryobacteraceae bacterium]